MKTFFSLLFFLLFSSTSSYAQTIAYQYKYTIDAYGVKSSDPTLSNVQYITFSNERKYCRMTDKNGFATGGSCACCNFYYYLDNGNSYAYQPLHQNDSYRQSHPSAGKYSIPEWSQHSYLWSKFGGYRYIFSKDFNTFNIAYSDGHTNVYKKVDKKNNGSQSENIPFYE